MPRPAFPRTVLEFQKRFAAEEACLEYLIASRWSEGFVCPRCGSTDAWWKASRRLFECKACRYQASVTAGTVMYRSRMPLRLWLVTTATDARAVEAAGIDAVVAQGAEAGGHRAHFVKPASPESGAIGTLALIPQVVDAVRIPVIAAGGIADGRGVVAALALGARGA